MREAGHQLRIISMRAPEDARRWAEHIGAVGHVAKPFEMDNPLSEVRRVLEQPA